MFLFLQIMGYLEKYRIFVPELRRSLHIAKYRNEQKSARFHIVTYIIWANAQLLDFQSKSNLERVTIFNGRENNKAILFSYRKNIASLPSLKRRSRMLILG